MYTKKALGVELSIIEDEEGRRIYFNEEGGLVWNTTMDVECVKAALFLEGKALKEEAE